MKLNAFAADAKKAIFDDLCRGEFPSIGSFDLAILNEARTKGVPQQGPTRFEPNAVVCEFIYGTGTGQTMIVTVKVDAPERIVFMPVPSWVVESIWQGEIDGSYHFVSHAQQNLAEFESELSSESNQNWFGPRPAKRRE